MCGETTWIIQDVLQGAVDPPPNEKERLVTTQHHRVLVRCTMTTLHCEGAWLARLEHDHLDKHIAQIVTSIHLPPFCTKQLIVPLHSVFCQQNLLLWHCHPYTFNILLRLKSMSGPSLRGVYRLCLCLVGSSCICILWFRHSSPLWLQEVWFPLGELAILDSSPPCSRTSISPLSSISSGNTSTYHTTESYPWLW